MKRIIKNKKGKNLPWHLEFVLWLWDKIEGHFEREEIEDENAKIKGIKIINLNLLIIILAIIVFLLIFRI